MLSLKPSSCSHGTTVVIRQNYRWPRLVSQDRFSFFLLILLLFYETMASSGAAPTCSVSTATTSTLIFQTPTALNPSISHQRPLKLDLRNYVLWKTLFLPRLAEFDLVKFVDGTTAIPAEVMGNNTSNPTFLSWE